MDHYDGYSPDKDEFDQLTDMPDSWGIAAWIAVLVFGALIGAVVVALWLT